MIDVAWAWGSLAWSPGGSTLAAAAESQQVLEGQIHLFDRSGRPVGAVPGWQASWIDDTHLMTIVRDPSGPGSSAWRWSADARTSALVAPNATGLLASSRGAVAIDTWNPALQRKTFYVWSSGVLSAALPGSPAAWSPDGRELVVLRDAGASSRSRSSGVVIASTGSVAPVYPEVLDASDLRRVAAFPQAQFDPRTEVLFNPTGTLVAAGAFVFDLAHDVAIALPLQGLDIAWTPGGRLVLESLADGSVSLWDPATHTLGPPLAPGTQLATSDHLVVTAPSHPGGWSQIVSPGVVSPDGTLWAWYPPADGYGGTPLRLVHAPTPQH